MDSHAYFLRVQGAKEETVKALAKADLGNAGLDAAELALLTYVKKVTQHAEQTTPDDVKALRDESWSNEQIAEAVYIAALFAFFNRVADAFGIESMGYLKADKLTL